MEQKKQDRLGFLFTKRSFDVDDRGQLLNEDLEKWLEAFEADRRAALYNLGFAKRPNNFDAAGLYLHQVADTFLEALTNNPDLELAREQIRVELDDRTASRLLESVPFTLGSEHVDRSWLERRFTELNEIFSAEIRDFSGSVAMYLSGKSQVLKVKERIFFHLVEAGDDDIYPFAFLATYSTKDDQGAICHVPLRYALTEYKNDRSKLIDLLSCLNRVAEVSPIIARFMDSGELFHPLYLTSEEAYELLLDVPKIEQAGIICRIPNWWRTKSRQLSLTVKVGAKKPSLMGLESIITSSASITVDGEDLSEAEIERLLAQAEGLIFLKGKWIEVNHERLQELLRAMKEAREASSDMTLLDAMRGELRMPEDGEDNGSVTNVVHGQWLADLMRRLRNPVEIAEKDTPQTLHAILRPYQQTGYSWLLYMNQLGFGACLADDMGLGKTVQVLSFLEQLRTENPDAHVLLIVPASLLGNWQKEAQRFVPEMSVRIVHGSAARQPQNTLSDAPAFLTITTYGMTIRVEALQKFPWDAVVLDEAQAIKNPKTKQSKQVRQLHARMKIALTGTPVENDLINLWAIFDFLNPGLLGTLNEFQDYSKGLASHPEGYTNLRNMIAPFMLRRMKTDKSIISDLPEKLEMVDYVTLSKKQTVLYRKVVDDIEIRLQEENMTNFERGALVLRSLIRLKQICNHPSQYLGERGFTPGDSGKFEVLRDLCETIRDNRERVLVFTQFKEITPYLDTFLHQVFGAKGFVLHGGTSIRKRSEIVEDFQSEKYYPYVVLSVKAGGTGLNLTNANHVIHFDRWWNPAVEDQATDRAFRIGQKKDVMVHKLVCAGTIEEQIDKLIESKKELARNVIGSGENWITELSNDALFELMQLR